MGLTGIKLSRHNRPTPIQPKKKREQNKENGGESKQKKETNQVQIWSDSKQVLVFFLLFSQIMIKSTDQVCLSSPLHASWMKTVQLHMEMTRPLEHLCKYENMSVSQSRI